MKRLLLFIILLFGLLPVFKNGEFNISLGNTAYGQSIATHAANYLNSINPDPNISYTASSHSCGCVVEIVDNGVFSHTMGYVWVDVNFVTGTPGFGSYMVGHGIEYNDPETDPEEDDDSEYNQDDYNEDFENFQESMEEFANMVNEFFSGGANGSGAEQPEPSNMNCEFYSWGDGWIADKPDAYNRSISGSGPCAVNKYLLKFKKIIRFTAAQEAVIDDYKLDGGTLIAIIIDGIEYRNGQGLTISRDVMRCEHDNWTERESSRYVSDRHGTFTFVAFDKLMLDRSDVYDSEFDCFLYSAIPPEYIIEILAVNIEDAVAGVQVVSSDESNNKYCYTLTPEDVRMTTRVGRDDPMKLPALNLQHPINVPDWARKFILDVLGFQPNPCVISYVNDKLDELHTESSYINAPKAMQAQMEYQNLAYDMLFGTLYCWTNEASVVGSGPVWQFGMGMVHEAIGTLDVKEITKGLIKIVEGAGSTANVVATNIINTVKDVIIQQTTTGTVNWEEIGMKFIEANTAIAVNAWNKIKTVADQFKRTYFTECDIDPNYGDICAYRYGQVTMMAVPIVVLGGQWAIVKLNTLIGKYVAKVVDAIMLINDAVETSKLVTTVPYTLVDDATSTIVTAQRTIIKDGNTIKSTIKQEGRPGQEYVVITKADDLINHNVVNNLVAETPAPGNFINSTKFKNNAHKIDTEADNFLKTESDKIFDLGDPNSAITESIQDYLFETKLQMQRLDGKYGSNNGFDGLFIEGTTSNPTKIYITESKQWSTGVQLATAQPTGLAAQMSDLWIDQVVNELRNAGKTAVADMITNNRSMVQKYVVVANKSTRDINILKMN